MISVVQNTIAHYHVATTIYQRIWIAKQPGRAFVGQKARKKLSQESFVNNGTVQ